MAQDRKSIYCRSVTISRRSPGRIFRNEG
nr:unnamed protein product [Callosobruchus analis]